ncbi:MAG: ABC transporter permease [Vicinamibacterales bacterium]
MTSLIKDLRHALRALARTRGWTAVVLLSLALGIGANTALFTAVNGLMLATVPVPDPESLVRVHWVGQNDMVRSSSSYGFAGTLGERSIRPTISYPMFDALRQANQTLTDLAAGAPMGSLNIILNGEAELASAYQASGAWFRLLGVPAAVGRVFGEADDRPDQSPVAVLSYGYWQRRFGGDEGVIGREISMSGVPVTIVGVTPRSFGSVSRLGDSGPDVIVPLAFDQRFNPPRAVPAGESPEPPRMSQPTYWWLEVIGRLKPGETIARVQANLGSVFQAEARAGMAQYVSSLTEAERNLSYNRRRGDAVPDLLVRPAAHGFYDVNPQMQRSAGYLAVVVVIVLLIVCANVANLLLSRATTREREVAVRLSLGATRPRLIRQLLTESLLLSCAGGALGILIGYWSKQLLPFGQDAPLDWRVFGFVAGVSVLTGIVFGLAPAFRATGVDLSGAMKESGRSVTSARTWLSQGLLVLQVAMSLVLLIGAGLFLRTIDNLRAVDVGFDAKNLLTFGVNPSLNHYDETRSALLFQQTLDRMAAVPGVRSAALAQVLPLSGSTWTSSIFRQGQTSDEPAEGNMYMMMVSPSFFSTMGIPIELGRGFTDRDGKDAPKVVVLNEAAARKLFPDGNVLGGRLGNSLEKAGAYEVIGVVRDTKYASLRDPGPPTMYQATLQQPQRSLQVILRTAGDPLAMTTAVRTAMRDVDPTLPIRDFTSATEQIEQRFSQERLFARAWSLFGGLALLLACIGLFGLMSYNVARRTNEIGIRMALGAPRGRVVRMVMRESLTLVAIGIALGFGASVWAGRFVETVLFGLTPMDGPTVTAAIGLVVLVSALAGFVPARRASRVDPMVALHTQ